MIDFNSGSGFVYGSDGKKTIGEMVNNAIDAMLIARQNTQKPRDYVSTSGIGRECMRQIQYDFMAVPKDEGADFPPKTLRIFEAGHKGEDDVADWLRSAGFDLRTHRSDGKQYGFSALNGKFKGHIDGCIMAPAPGVEMEAPALWENKELGSDPWADVHRRGVVVSKPVYAAQIAIYQAYMELPAPALFTARNRDTRELHCELVPFDAALAQRMSDRVVDVIKACEAQDLLPRCAATPESVLCRGGKTREGFAFKCAWRNRCWGLS